MRHKRRVAKLNKAPGHRKAMLKNLAASVIQYEGIKTTEAKAKAVAPIVERIITLGKKDTIASNRKVYSMLPTELASKKVLEVLVPRYKSRKGGYTTRMRMSKRVGDDSRMIRLSLVKDVEKKREPTKDTKK